MGWVGREEIKYKNIELFFIFVCYYRFLVRISLSWGREEVFFDVKCKVLVLYGI